MLFWFILQTLKIRHLEKRDNMNILCKSLLLSSTSENMQVTSKPRRLADSLSLVMDIKA